MTGTITVISLIICYAACIQAFYLPGLAPNVFCRNQIPESKCKVSRWENTRI